MLSLSRNKSTAISSAAGGNFRTFIRKMSRVNINYGLKGPKSEDPANVPCLIIGLGKNINQLTFDNVKHKLLPRVSEEVLRFLLFYPKI